MRRTFSIGVMVVCLLGIGGCGTSAVSWQHASFGRIPVRNTPVVLLPFARVQTKYADNTSMTADTQFTDSFLIETCNALLAFECGKQFKKTGLIADTMDDTGAPVDSTADMVTVEDGASPILRIPRYSILAGDTLQLNETADHIRSVARNGKAELVLVPYTCTIKYNVYKPAGWRNDKYEGGSYTRPTTYMAVTSVHLQVWHKDGRLLFEKIGTSVTDRPLFYTFFHKDQPTGTDIVGFAKKIYAPPLIKSLYKAMKVALILL